MQAIVVAPGKLKRTTKETKMANQKILVIQTPTVIANKNPVNSGIALNDKYENGQANLNEIRGFLAGAKRGRVLVGTASPGASDAVTASFTASLSGAMTAADTVTINGQALTAVAATPAANQFIVGVDAPTDAASLAACINAYATTAQKVVGIVNAVAAAGIVTVSANIPGVIGNLVTCTKSASAVTLGGLTSNSPTNGAGGLPVLKSYSYGY